MIIFRILAVIAVISVSLALSIFALSIETDVSRARAYQIRQQTVMSTKRLQLELKEDEAVLPAKVESRKTRIQVFTYAVSLVMIVGSLSLSFILIAVAIKVYRLSLITLIPLDPKTNQYPLVLSRGRFFEPNMMYNAGLSVENQPNRQLTSGAHPVRMISASSETEAVNWSKLMEKVDENLLENHSG